MKIITNYNSFFKEELEINITKPPAVLSADERIEFFTSAILDVIKEINIIPTAEYDFHRVEYSIEENEYMTYGATEGIVTFLLLKKENLISSKPFFWEILQCIQEEGLINLRQLLNYSGRKLLQETFKRFLGLRKNNKLNLFDTLHNISLLKYETSESYGKILFCTRSLNGIELENAIFFKDPFLLTNSNYKAIRKLLEISNDKLLLLCDGFCIFGIGQINETIHVPTDLFLVKFEGAGNWSLSTFLDTETNKRIMDVSNGNCELPKDPIEKPDFYKRFEETFKDEENYQHYNCEKIWEYIQVAKRQKHGTMIIITNNAKKEAERFSNQCFQIFETNNISPEVVLGITSIDGAVLIDPQGFCHAVGVILDGKANKKFGDISRGARYNSALRYINSTKEESPCLVVIVSEDGYWDIKSAKDIHKDELALDKYLKQIINLANDPDENLASRASEEYCEFEVIIKKLLEAEIMARHAIQLAAQYNKDKELECEFEEVYSNEKMLLSEKINSYEKMYRQTLFQKGSDN